MSRLASPSWRPLQLLVLLLLVGSVAGLVVGCDRKSRTKTVVVEPDPAPAPDPVNPGPDSPFLALWENSAHADETAEAFVHWDGYVPPVVPTGCAKCHSSTGYLDFLGADGTTQWVVDAPHDVGTVIDCETCHNAATATLDEVTFPSGAHIDGLGAEARCMQCHQGRNSTPNVDGEIANSGLADDEFYDFDVHGDTKEPLGFENIHYFAAGATLYGRQAAGAYQYAGMRYDGKFPHVTEYDTCIECHDPHSLEVKVDECAACHDGVNVVADAKSIRMAGSVPDYDGDGDADEGIYGEIDTLRSTLYTAIQSYGANALGKPIMYDSHAYPYFFNDNGAGANYGNRYQNWTPRLLRAAYNFQYASKDPGAFAHNAKYVIEVLYDSLADLDSHAAVTVADLAEMVRNDVVHFDATAEAFRYFDGAGEVRTSCARCHSNEGFNFYAEFLTDPLEAAPVTDGHRCDNCHEADSFGDDDPARKFVAKVTFPSGISFDNDPTNPDDSFICMTCHQGRESKADVDQLIADNISDPAENPLGFLNIHYLSAGGTLYGDDAEVGYQYDTKTYSAKWDHYGTNAGRCTVCHLTDHTFEPQFTAFCAACHVEVGPNGDLHDIRLFRTIDYNGNGDTTEQLVDEVQTFVDRLYAAILDHAANTIGTPVGYDDHAYPYFFNDTNGNGVLETDPDGDPTTNDSEIGYGNRYQAWDAALLKGAFNFQLSKKEPGAWAHNTNYLLQLLYDSIEDLGGDLTNLTRPTP